MKWFNILKEIIFVIFCNKKNEKERRNAQPVIKLYRFPVFNDDGKVIGYYYDYYDTFIHMPKMEMKIGKVNKRD